MRISSREGRVEEEQRSTRGHKNDVVDGDEVPPESKHSGAPKEPC